MNMSPTQIVVNDMSSRLLTGRNEFSRSLGGALIVPRGDTFPTASYTHELFFNTLSSSLYVRNDDNTEWIKLGASDPNASYVTIGATGSLSNERVLTGGTGINFVDNGAGSTVVATIDDNVVATVSGTTFTGPVSASAGISGSLTMVGPNLSFIVAGTGITVTSSSNGQIVIGNAYASQTPADSNAAYLVLAATSSLPNERVFSVSGSSLSLTDSGGVATIDIANTGSAGTYGVVQVNSKGQITSGSTSWFGQNFWFVTASLPFNNPTTTYLSAIDLSASNLTPGIYRFGWSYTMRCNTATNSFRARCFIVNSASYDTVEEMSDATANERNMRSGFAYVVINSTTASFGLQVSIEAAATNTTASVYERALELWRVS